MPGLERVNRAGTPAPSHLLAAAAGLFAARSLYRLLARGALTLDPGIGRTLLPLGPVPFQIAAPRELVFEVIAGPYLGPTPRALASELRVWERSSEMVLAAHYTEAKCGTTTTAETVRFERPERILFRVVRGPVPHVLESFVLAETDRGTLLTWEGELGTDFWDLGRMPDYCYELRRGGRCSQPGTSPMSSA